MKKLTPVEIYELFLSEDKNTILRKMNLRCYLKQSNVDYFINQGKWFINIESLIHSFNPLNIQSHIHFPRMRNKKTAIIEWNKTHNKKIKHHIVDKICNSGKIFVYHNGRHNVINYDQLEQELTKIFDKTSKNI